MKLTFHGASGEVTGSSYCVETSAARMLVDCGMFQGGKEADARNRAPTIGRMRDLDAVLLTHGHLDHTGRLPLLVKAGYRGPIFATPATIEMTGLILRDSAKLQLQDNERLNRKRARAGQPPQEPLYTAADVEQTLGLLQPAPYDAPFPVAPGAHACLLEAGHMLGSVSIKLTATDAGREKSIVFSGDLGPKGAPILKDAETFQTADAVVLESTYGDRDHRPFGETVEQFIAILKTAVAERGKILIPTFAIGRAQTLTTLLAWIFRKRLVKPFPVFLDSPMAAEAWNIYERHHELYDDDMLEFIRTGSLKRDLATLQTAPTAEDSKKINDMPGPCLVLAGAGMCNGGRIVHHLRQNLWRPGTHVIIAGFQAYGTLGRRLVEGAKEVSIFGEKVAVKAQLHTLGGFSAHAGQTDLLQWFAPLAASRPRVFLTHGEDEPRRELARQLQSRHRLRATLPQLRDVVEL